MAFHDLRSPSEERFWSAVRTELREIAWLVAIVAALSVAGVALAVILAGV